MVYTGPLHVNDFSSITTQTVANSILAGPPYFENNKPLLKAQNVKR